MTEFQPSPFEPIKTYDVGQVILKQIADNEVTMEGIWRTFASPERLSPKERDTFATRLKERAGGGPIVDAGIEILTNPFVWLMFLTTPGATTALRTTGRVAPIPKQFGAFALAEEKVGLLQTFGGYTPMQSIKNTHAEPAAFQVMERMRQLAHKSGSVYGKAVDTMLRRNKLRHFERSRLKPGSDGDRINLLLHESLAGNDRDIVTRTLFLRTPKKGKWKLEVKEVLQKARVPQSLDPEIQSIPGLMRTKLRLRRAMDERVVDLFGDTAHFKASGQFKSDPLKIERAIYAVRNPTVSAKNSQIAEGRELIARIVGDDITEAIAAGKITPKQIQAGMDDVLTHAFKTKAFMPRNIRTTYNPDGSLATIREAQARAKETRIFAAATVIPRGTKRSAQDPVALRQIREFFGTTPRLEREIARSEKTMAELKPTELAAFEGIDSSAQLDKYFFDTADTIAWHIDDVDNATRAARREFLRHADSKKIESAEITLKDFHGPIGSKKAELVQTPADAMFETHHLMANSFAKSTLSELIIPLATGRLNLTRGAMMHAALKAKASLRGLVESPVGKAMEEHGGDLGKKWVAKWRELGDPTLGLGPTAGSELSGGIARYLYVTHLGINLASVTLNSMQPWLHAGTFLGYSDIARAYGPATKQLGNYLKARSKLGVRITPVQRERLMRESFPDYELMDISPDTWELIEGLSFQSSQFTREGPLQYWTQSFPMKLFEKAEWLNRLVVANAVRGKVVRELGPKALITGTHANSKMIQDARTVIQNTQFGGSKFNQPVFMIRQLNDPNLRAFLQFPYRSLTSAVSFFPKAGATAESGYLAGRTFREFGFGAIGGPTVKIPAIMGDFFRMIGGSAVIYEASKAILNADLTRGLGVAAVTDLFANDRFLEEGNPIPIPPAIDIPFDLVRGAAIGDMALLGRTLPRLVPGGVGIARLFNAMPRLPESALADLPRSIQRNYVDYKNPLPDGRVPIHTGDGRIVGYEKPANILLRSLGADLGRYSSQAELDNFLVNNRDEMVEFRRRYIDALIRNDTRDANKIRALFHRRFGFDLQVSRQQIQSQVKLRQIPRTERILDRLPVEARGVYQQILAATHGVPERLGLQPEALTAEHAASKRERASSSGGEGSTRSGALLDEVVRRDTAARDERGFGEFSSF